MSDATTIVLMVIAVTAIVSIGVALAVLTA